MTPAVPVFNQAARSSYLSPRPASECFGQVYIDEKVNIESRHMKGDVGWENLVCVFFYQRSGFADNCSIDKPVSNLG